MGIGGFVEKHILDYDGMWSTFYEKVPRFLWKIFGMNLKIENLKLESSDFGIDTWKVVLFESIFLRK